MSLTRNREGFSLEELYSIHVRYFEHLQAKALDLHILEEASGNIPLLQPSFLVRAARRVSKIEDEEQDTGSVLQRCRSLIQGAIAGYRDTSGKAAPACTCQPMVSPVAPRCPQQFSWSPKDLVDWDTLSPYRTE